MSGITPDSFDRQLESLTKTPLNGWLIVDKGKLVNVGFFRFLFEKIFSWGENNKTSSANIKRAVFTFLQAGEDGCLIKDAAKDKVILLAKRVGITPNNEVGHEPDDKVKHLSTDIRIQKLFNRLAIGGQTVTQSSGMPTKLPEYPNEHEYFEKLREGGDQRPTDEMKIKEESADKLYYYMNANTRPYIEKEFIEARHERRTEKIDVINQQLATGREKQQSRLEAEIKNEAAKRYGSLGEEAYDNLTPAEERDYENFLLAAPNRLEVDKKVQEHANEMYQGFQTSRLTNQTEYLNLAKRKALISKQVRQELSGTHPRTPSQQQQTVAVLVGQPQGQQPAQAQAAAPTANGVNLSPTNQQLVEAIERILPQTLERSTKPAQKNKAAIIRRGLEAFKTHMQQGTLVEPLVVHNFQDNSNFVLTVNHNSVKYPSYFSNTPNNMDKLVTATSELYNYKNQSGKKEAIVNPANATSGGGAFHDGFVLEEKLACESDLVYHVALNQQSNGFCSVEIRQRLDQGIPVPRQERIDPRIRAGQGNPNPHLFVGIHRLVEVDAYGSAIENFNLTKLTVLQTPQSINVLSIAAPKLYSKNTSEQYAEGTLADIFNTLVAGLTLARENGIEVVNSCPLGCGVFNNSDRAVYLLHCLAAQYIPDVEIKLHAYSADKARQFNGEWRDLKPFLVGKTLEDCIKVISTRLLAHPHG